MPSEQLGAEIGLTDQERKDSATHAASGLGGGMAAGVGYGFYKGNEAYLNREHLLHLTSVYNQKGRATTIHSSSHKQVARGQGLIQIHKALLVERYGPGVAGGFFGPKTKVALEKFQDYDGLNVTGEVDATTKNLLSGLSCIIYSPDLHSDYHRPALCAHKLCREKLV